jgi:hypothetical protein
VTRTESKAGLGRDGRALCGDRGDRQRPLLRRAGLGNQDPTRRKWPVAAVLKCPGELVEQPVNPVPLDLGDVNWSMPGAQRLRRTSPHARCRTSLRETLSYSAWNRRPGSALAARYSACCKARTASSSSTPTPGVGLATTGTHRPSLQPAHRRNSGPSHHRRLCCPSGSIGTTASSDALLAGRPLPGRPVTGRHAPASSAVAGPARASPVPTVTFQTFRALYAEEFLAAALPGLHRFHGLRPEGRGSALP